MIFFLGRAFYHEIDNAAVKRTGGMRELKCAPCSLQGLWAMESREEERKEKVVVQGSFVSALHPYLNHH